MILFDLNQLNRYHLLTRLEISAEVGLPNYRARPLRVRLNFPHLRYFAFRRFDERTIILNALRLRFLSVISYTRFGHFTIRHHESVTSLSTDWPVNQPELFPNVTTLYLHGQHQIGRDVFEAKPHLQQVYYEDFEYTRTSIQKRSFELAF